jgi:regulator of CtrA degradation
VSNTVNLAEKFTRSEKFKELFQEGMGLVEESAAFLDGEGREEAKGLSRTTAMLYGSESMRLTTRLMQLASWLLLQRAANEGEMGLDQLLEEKKKIRLEETVHEISNPSWNDLPQSFTELVERSVALQTRVMSLDTELYGEDRSEDDNQSNPVSQQIDLLSTALGAIKR